MNCGMVVVGEFGNCWVRKRQTSSKNCHRISVIVDILGTAKEIRLAGKSMNATSGVTRTETIDAHIERSLND